jgi:hypothetical protein
MNHCAAQQQLCPSYQLVLTPPDGWVLDAKATAENKVQILVRKGQNFARTFDLRSEIPAFQMFRRVSLCFR